MRITLLLAILCAPVFGQTYSPASTGKIDFGKQVFPILSAKCFSCHGLEVRQAGLRLDRRQPALRGGDYGPVIIPGNSAESRLIKRVVDGDGKMQMPPTGPLSPDEIAILKAWVDQGADYRMEIKDDPAPNPVDPELAKLISAVRNRQKSAVEKMLSKNPELVRAVDQQGATVLHHAAGFGDIATMSLLLDKGADVNAKNRRKSTPLFWAIHDEAKVRLLVERGADVNVRQADGRTPLYQTSVLGNSLGTMRLLLERGADPNIATAPGMTPLMMASFYANLPAMRLLIEKGAKINAKSAAGVTPLFEAAASGDSRTVQLLLEKGADAKVATKRNETPLMEAATNGDEASIKMLVEHGADVNARDVRGYSALLYAAGSDTMPADAVKYLIEKGAKVDVTTEGETPFTLAAKRGDTPVTRLLAASDQDRARSTVAPTPVAMAIRDRSASKSVELALGLLEKQSYNFIRIAGCNSCHAQDLPSTAVGVAREHGIPTPKMIQQLSPEMVGTGPERIMDLNFVTTGSVAWELFDSGSNRVPADRYTDAVVRLIKAMQKPEGNWHTAQSRRPPMATGAYQTAALSIYAMRQYSPAAEKADTDKSIARAAAWLAASKPSITQDRAFLLLGLGWAGRSNAALQSSVKALVSMQRTDGGWGQLPGMASDAYATGMALYALNTAGKMATTNPVYQKGVRYLAQTQADDGSWHVKSRSIWLQPYFESGFPYEHDQWISAAGTAWASMALSLTVEPQRISRN